MAGTIERDVRFLEAIRRTVQEAMDDGIAGPVIIARLEREAAILRERMLREPLPRGEG